MFSGIVTECLPCLKVYQESSILRIEFHRPLSFQDLSEGDSICVDGVCLTVEKLSGKEMIFALGPETLKITQWKKKDLKNKIFNLEKALTFHQTLGGHLVTGHVDQVARVSEYHKEGMSVLLNVELPKGFEKFFWKKGYITLNGVSLTVNTISQQILSVCLIPKTLEKTNLSDLKVGDQVNFEVDYFARFFVHGFEHLKSQFK
ncbi:MAG: riboflavin synthase [Bdellovibrionales bacterium]|nr:riboflavin synthase [Bdellovibrionales bacterium]